MSHLCFHPFLYVPFISPQFSSLDFPIVPVHLCPSIPRISPSFPVMSNPFSCPFIRQHRAPMCLSKVKFRKKKKSFIRQHCAPVCFTKIKFQKKSTHFSYLTLHFPFMSIYFLFISSCPFRITFMSPRCPLYFPSFPLQFMSVSCPFSPSCSFISPSFPLHVPFMSNLCPFISTSYPSISPSCRFPFPFISVIALCFPSFLFLTLLHFSKAERPEGPIHVLSVQLMPLSSALHFPFVSSFSSSCPLRVTFMSLHFPQCFQQCHSDDAGDAGGCACAAARAAG